VLWDAAGRITVEIEGVLAGKKYAIYLGSPLSGGGPAYPPVVTSGPSVDIENLAVREWVVSVSLSDGGSVVSKTVTLTRDETSQSVRLNVSGLEAAKPMRLGTQD
jgi:hypothetical protein